MADEERVERVPPRKYGKRRFRDGIDMHGRRKWSGVIEKSPIVIDKRTKPVQRTDVGNIETYDSPGEVEETIVGGGDPAPEKFKVVQQPPAKLPIESPTVIHEPAATIYSRPEEDPVIMSAKDLTPPIEVEEEPILLNKEEEASIEEAVSNSLSESNETLDEVEAKLNAVIAEGEYTEPDIEAVPEQTVIDHHRDPNKHNPPGLTGHYVIGEKALEPDSTVDTMNFSSWDGDQKMDLTQDETEPRNVTED